MVIKVRFCCNFSAAKTLCVFQAKIDNYLCLLSFFGESPPFILSLGSYIFNLKLPSNKMLLEGNSSSFFLF